MHHISSLVMGVLFSTDMTGLGGWAWQLGGWTHRARQHRWLSWFVRSCKDQGLAAAGYTAKGSVVPLGARERAPIHLDNPRSRSFPSLVKRRFL